MDYYTRLFMEGVTDDISELEIFNEATSDTHIIVEKLYPKISSVLSTPQGDRKFKQLIGQYMDRNSQKLRTPGPTYLVPFTSNDKAQYCE